MKTFETKLTVYPAALLSSYGVAIDCNPNAIDFDDAFEGEIGWVAQSGITLNDYIVSTKDDKTVIIDALFDVDETLLSEYSEGSLEDAFKNEFGWLAESGVYLDRVMLN